MTEEENTFLYNMYFGRSADYYTERLQKFNDGQRFTFNGYAILGGLFWVLFRKLYLEAFVIIVIISVSGIFENWLYGYINHPLLQTTISFTITALFFISYGLFANYFYIKKAIRVVEAAKLQFTDFEQLTLHLRKKGGTSLLPILIFTLILVTYLVLLSKAYSYS